MLINYLLNLRFTRQGSPYSDYPRALRTSLVGRLVGRRSLIRWVTLAASLGLEGIRTVMPTERGVKITKIGPGKARLHSVSC
jgi:hypothetical protein